MLFSWKYRGRGDGEEQGNHNPERGAQGQPAVSRPGAPCTGGRAQGPALCPCSAPRRLLQASSSRLSVSRQPGRFLLTWPPAAPQNRAASVR